MTTGNSPRPSPRGHRRAGREPGSARRSARGALLGLGAGALLLGAGAWAWAAPSEGPVADAGRVPTASAAAPAAPAPAAAPQVSPEAGPPTPAAAPAPTALPTLTAAATSFVPTRLQIPAVDIDSRVTPVAVSDGELGVPENPAVLGWWRGGARPGSGLGTVVVDGHVDSKRYGTGPLYRATRLKIGDLATLSGGGQELTYRVVALRTYLKATLPAQEVFAQRGPERLVVVTCGGEYHRGRGGWDSNVVVYLEPVR